MNTSTNNIIRSYAFFATIVFFLLTYIRADTKCTPDGTTEFRQEYEKCKKNVLDLLKNNLQVLKDTNQNESNMKREMRNILCDSLRDSIDRCTPILGWCFSEDEVEATKEKQVSRMVEYLRQMFDDKFDADRCLREYGENQPRVASNDGSNFWITSSFIGILVITSSRLI